MQVGFLITGNEVLSAKTRDTNGPFMGMHLRKYGVPVTASMMCCDDEKDLLSCLRYLSERCDAILMTGGLGPTSDDLTATIVAQFLQTKTQFNSEAWDNCVDFYHKLGRTEIPESNRKQAELPAGCTLLSNPIGTAVGFKVSGQISLPRNNVTEKKTVTVFCMPGVPYEMEGMFLNSVLPDLTRNVQKPVVKTWQVFALGESAMQNKVQSIESELKRTFPNNAVSYQAHPGYVTYTVTLFASDEYSHADLTYYLNHVYAQQLQTAIGKYILYTNEKKLSEFLVETLEEQNLTLAFAETSCGGYLSKECVLAEPSAHVYAGSLVAHGPALWKQLFGVTSFAENIESTLAAVAAKTQQHTGAHVVFAEHGAPSAAQAHAQLPHGRFYFVLLLERTRFAHLEKIEHALAEFSWQKQNAHDSRYAIFVNKQDISTRYAPDTQKTRAALYGLCSIVLGLMSEKNTDKHF